ncbi:DMT family transporter [Legionella oakridgensis]|uniref:Permease of the drug/metabolite transporter DMT superfamily n=2 Tax=Legionella oakridgensis TaxID=29423 RepID=W0BI36_9GAMM|nr:DMT family transporter [Legionella oakridgensis]AHE68351.1 permease of the drug/metabolite transporter DMT superfamily [Legionella oakridgensis ATCC 33761 = DSM 21215]ETO92213.1 permease of the drug/metabolite transporter (DMT) superfamily [Legionella oakridgensis RV-2-2007]KTD38978.1 transmembrane protein [Legionella oakridgensis]STY21294.1 transmembrane protein [Legionella longbeachae]
MIKKYLYLIITGLLFGSQFLITLQAMQGYTALDVALMRVLFGFIMVASLVPLFSSSEKSVKIKWYHYALIGFFEGTFPCVLVPWGQQQIDTGIAAVIISTMPIFAMIFGPFLIKEERFSLFNIISILIGFIGVYVLIHPGGNGAGFFSKIIPELAILTASASWALSLVLIKKLPEMSPFILTRNILLAATIEIGLIWILFGDPMNFEIKTIPLMYGILLGVLNSGIVYIFYVLLIRAAGVNFAAFSNYLVPVVGGILGIAFLHETYETYELIGFLIIMIGLLMNTVRDLYLYKNKG